MKPWLRSAILRGDVEVVAEYLGNGGGVDVRDQRGRTPLMIASMKGHPGMCQLLLEHGADRGCRDSEGLSAIELAQAGGFGELGALLSVPMPEDESDIPEPLEEPDSGLFDQWLPEDEVSIREDGDGGEGVAIARQSQVIVYRIEDPAETWDDVDVELPDPVGLAIGQELHRDDIQRDVHALLMHALQQGACSKEQILAISREVDGLPQSEFQLHLTQLLGDLGVVVEADDQWLEVSAISDEDGPERLDDEIRNYLIDLSTLTSDPYFQLRKEVDASVLLGQEGEARIGRSVAVAISEACHAMAEDPDGLDALARLADEVQRDPNLLGKVTRLDEEGLEEASPSRDSTDQTEEAQCGQRAQEFVRRVSHIQQLRAEQTGRAPTRAARQGLAHAIQRLEFTTAGIRSVDRRMKDAGSIGNTRLASALHRLDQLERELFMANLRLATSIASNYRWSSLPQMDLIQEAFLGLMKAVVKFDHNRGFRFSTYATWWIRQAVTRAIGDTGRMIRVPIHMLEKVGKLERIARENGSMSAAELPVEILVAGSGYTVEEVNKALGIVEEPVSWDQDPAVEDCVLSVEDGQPGPPDRFEQEDLRRCMRTSFGNLTDQQALVLRQRFGLDNGVEKTLEEVGRMMGVTRERIRQIETKALGRLRAPSVAGDLEVFLLLDNAPA